MADYWSITDYAQCKVEACQAKQSSETQGANQWLFITGKSP